MQRRMVPQLLSGPGRMFIVDAEGCLSLEVITTKRGDDFIASVRDHAFPGTREPREAAFYSVSDRAVFVKALMDSRLKLCADVPRSSRPYLYRPRVTFA